MFSYLFTFIRYYLTIYSQFFLFQKQNNGKLFLFLNFMMLIFHWTGKCHVFLFSFYGVNVFRYSIRISVSYFPLLVKPFNRLLNCTCLVLSSPTCCSHQVRIWPNHNNIGDDDEAVQKKKITKTPTHSGRVENKSYITSRKFSAIKHNNIFHDIHSD